VRVADYNRRFEITSTPITTPEFYRLIEGSKTWWQCKGPADFSAGPLNGVGQVQIVKA